MGMFKGATEKVLQSTSKDLMTKFKELIDTHNQLIDKVNTLIDSHQRICDYLDTKIIEVKSQEGSDEPESEDRE